MLRLANISLKNIYFSCAKTGFYTVATNKYFFNLSVYRKPSVWFISPCVSQTFSESAKTHHHADQLLANTIGYYTELATISTYMCFEVQKTFVLFLCLLMEKLYYLTLLYKWGPWIIDGLHSDCSEALWDHQVCLTHQRKIKLHSVSFQC